MTHSRKIAVLSGKRGGFGAMKHLLSKLQDSSEFDLQLILTDQHLDHRFGATLKEVSSFFTIAAAIPLFQADGSPKARAQALGRCASEMANVLSDLEPDLLVLYGDRGEVLATALAASTLRIPIAHIQGGDVSGSLDENMRHAITKLSTIHFPSIQESAERLRRLGEKDDRIFVVGDSHLDCIKSGEYEPFHDVCAKLQLPLSAPLGVILQHPDANYPHRSFQEMQMTLEIARSFDLNWIVIYPCSDPGFEGTISAIESRRSDPIFSLHKNLEAHIFWGLLSGAEILVGNSSAGLIETPSFGLPAVNLGDRQRGRVSAENVIHSKFEVSEMRAAIDTALYDEEFRIKSRTCRNPYGEGNSGQRIYEVLKALDFSELSSPKVMTY